MKLGFGASSLDGGLIRFSGSKLSGIDHLGLERMLMNEIMLFLFLAFHFGLALGVLASDWNFVCMTTELEWLNQRTV